MGDDSMREQHDTFTNSDIQAFLFDKCIEAGQSAIRMNNWMEAVMMFTRAADKVDRYLVDTGRATLALSYVALAYYKVCNFREAERAFKKANALQQKISTNLHCKQTIAVLKECIKERRVLLEAEIMRHAENRTHSEAR